MNRNIGFVAVFALILVSYGAINYYIGLRGWQTVGRSLPWVNSKAYWAFIWFLAFSYIAARLVRNITPVFVERLITYIGAYWMAAFYYFFFIILFIDLIRFLDRWLGLIPEQLKANAPIVGWGVLLLVTGLLIYGTWNARSPIVNHYDITINKKAGNMDQLHAVMVSDVHLGLIMDNDRLVQMVGMVNELNPDIVLLPGDILDESIEPFIEQKMADTFKKLNPPLGVYMVPGNHEYIGENDDDLVRYMKEGGVEVLMDCYVKVNEGFYVVGRDDTGHGRRGRKALAELLQGVDRTFPLILLDHNPNQPSLKDAQEEGIDLQLSGHTHRGQFFPNNLITNRIFEDDWGYLSKGFYQLVVSDGFGTWGPPIRIGNHPKIVDLTIRFETKP